MHYAITLLIATCLSSASTQLVLAATPAEDAISAAKVYTARLGSGEVKKAVLDCWQTDALLSGSFGLMYLELPEPERRRAQSAFADFVAAPFSNERLSTLFKSIAVKKATSKTIDASSIAVQLELEGDAGRFHAVNTLLLVKTGAGWRITDQRQSDQVSIRTALSVTYMESAKGRDDTIPVVLERVAAQTRQQMSEKGRPSGSP